VALTPHKNKDTTGFNFWPKTSLAECEALMSETQTAYAAPEDKTRHAMSLADRKDNMKDSETNENWR
jgi:hypothetical protein